MNKRYLLPLALVLLAFTGGLLVRKASPPSGKVRIGNKMFPFADAPGRRGALQSPATTSLAIVKTSARLVPEAMIIDGGSWRRSVEVAMSGFLVRHGKQVLGFDIGLGSQIDEQFSADMPLWAKPVFAYARPVKPMAQQLAASGIKPPRVILLSHSHWDHAAGLEDFRAADVWASGKELQKINAARASGTGSPWPSQVGASGIHWQNLRLTGGSYMGFDHSLDLFGDQTVVAVSLPGHTSGSIGLFVRVAAGHRYLLVGDAIWNSRQLLGGRGKFLMASWMVDEDRNELEKTIKFLSELAHRHPDITIVPAHDGNLHSLLGTFPHWITR